MYSNETVLEREKPLKLPIRNNSHETCNKGSQMHMAVSKQKGKPESCFPHIQQTPVRAQISGHSTSLSVCLVIAEIN